ncbi:MAG: pentapeptide repeat-containing protein [Thermomicrobiales bacterium]
MTAIIDDAHYEGEQFTRLIVQERVFSGIDFSACIFDHCVFSECTFYRCSFTECRFRACDLSLAKVHGSRFTDVGFAASKLVGIDWTKAGDAVISKLFLSVHFDDCLLSYVSFFGLTLPRSRFVGCIAREVDFRDADLTEADCTGTDFSGSKFHHTNLTKADFRRATDYTIDPTANTISKARFALPEAVSLLSGFDIVIE